MELTTQDTQPQVTADTPVVVDMRDVVGMLVAELAQVKAVTTVLMQKVAQLEQGNATAPEGTVHDHDGQYL